MYTVPSSKSSRYFEASQILTDLAEDVESMLQFPVIANKILHPRSIDRNAQVSC